MELLESSGVRPRQARYQAALRPDKKCKIHSKAVGSHLLIRITGLNSSVHELSTPGENMLFTRVVLRPDKHAPGNQSRAE
jgi:hypothetical protein